MTNLENEVLIELLETVADNKFIMGDHLVEIGVSGPNLEATLSAVAIAQAELGHARLLYNWIQELKTGKRKRIEIEKQTGKAFSTAIETEDWISLIASLYTTDVAAEVILGAISNSEFSTKTVTKMVKEQKDNITYARSWCNQLVNDKGKIPVKFKADFEKAKMEASVWLHSCQNDDRLKHLGVFNEETDVIKSFNEEMDSILPSKEPVHAE